VISRVTLVLAGVLVLSGCDRFKRSDPGETPPDPPSPSVQSRYVHRAPNAAGIVVFVHGVFGDATKTWVNTKTGASWPELVAKDGDFSGYDVYAVDYMSPFFHSASNVEEIAQRVVTQLTDAKIFQYKQIYFVAHSMGGLIVKRMLNTLLKPSTVAELRNVRAAIFLSTPAQGAPVADVASWLTMNPQLKNMQPSDFNAFLQMLENDWQSLLRERDFQRDSYPQSYCAYETLPTSGVPVVTRLYATSRCDNTPYPMDFDHGGIAKPADAGTDPYAWAKARLQQADTLARFNQAPANTPIARTAEFREITAAGAPPTEAAMWSNALGDSYWTAAAGTAAPSATQASSALVAYQTAARLDPANALYPAKLGSSLTRLGRYDEAIANLRKAIALDPTVGWYHGELCDALARAGQGTDATTSCQAAVRLDPKMTTDKRTWEQLMKGTWKPSRGSDSIFKPAVMLKP
jgi:tetratricopeptide (TPR) repeat protein